MEIVIQLIGISGAFLTLSAFILNQTDKLKNTDFTYDFLNFLSGTLLAVYAYLICSWPFLIINLVWGLFSLKDLIKRKNNYSLIISLVVFRKTLYSVSKV